MSKKCLSLIIIPHHKGKPKTITLTNKALKALAGSGIFIFLILVFFLVDYFTMNVTRGKYKQLLKKNQKQEATIAQYQKSIQQIKTTIDHFENYTKKINIMAGLKSPNVLKDVGIGGENVSSSQIVPKTESQQNIGLDRLKNINQKADGIEKNLNTLVKFFEVQSLKLAATPSIWPTKGWVTSAFGWRNDPFTGKRAFHKGIDIATNLGNPVIATADGIVIQLKREKIGGNVIIISHRGGYTTVYCHLNKFLVKPGQRVKRGDVIGEVGETGKALGPHVHYEVRINGRSVNPYNYILEE